MLKHTQAKIVDGTHQQIIRGPLSSMLVEWHKITCTNDQALLVRHGEHAGLALADVVPTLVYARVSMAALSLCGLSDIEDTKFDPVEFGKRCEAIAREQSELYRTTNETAGTA
jgi:hypothetical protein